jgi:hypothetical protein
MVDSASDSCRIRLPCKATVSQQGCRKSLYGADKLFNKLIK